MDVKKIVFVGQTPPPFGGQSIMIDKILTGQYNAVTLYHVRLAFSKEMDEIGKFSISKVVHLLSVITKILWLRIARNASTLYYPPAGPDKIPVLRDIVILIATRWMFKKTIFHFHAGGVSEMQLKGMLKTLFHIAYKKPDCAILLSDLNPPDGKRFEARKQIIIPYGIEDYAAHLKGERKSNAIPVLLFVGVIKQSKGVLVLLQACRQLQMRGVRFELQIVGKFDSPEFERTIRTFVQQNSLEEKVIFHGVLSGDRKFEVYRDADIFCFPTFFESETFGVVLLEAMQFSLPLVATKWRGIPSIVEENENGFLVEPNNSETLAQKLLILLENPALRKQMGAAGRKSFLSKFTIEKFRASMNDAFLQC